MSDQIKDILQSHYLFMVQMSTYDSIAGPSTRDVLASEVRNLSSSLQQVHAAALARRDVLPSVPAELIQYVEDGRNPDIYTREFVELTRRTNQLARGKTNAFASFRDVLADQIRAAMPELADDVDRVLETTGGGSASAAAAAAAAPSAGAQQQQQSSSG